MDTDHASYTVKHQQCNYNAYRNYRKLKIIATKNVPLALILHIGMMQTNYLKLQRDTNKEVQPQGTGGFRVMAPYPGKETTCCIDFHLLITHFGPVIYRLLGPLGKELWYSTVVGRQSETMKVHQRLESINIAVSSTAPYCTSMMKNCTITLNARLKKINI